MKRNGQIAALASLMLAVPMAFGQSAVQQDFQRRQLQLDLLFSRLNARVNRPMKRGGISAPTEVEGKIYETRRNHDGSLTATTNTGKSVTYDPQTYRPYYSELRNRTLFGLIPNQSMSVAEYWTRAPDENGVRTTVTYADLPYGNLPAADAKHSTTISLSQETDWQEGQSASDSVSLAGNYQFNSDLAPVQFSGGTGLSLDQGSAALYDGSVSASHVIAGIFTPTATMAYYDGGTSGAGAAFLLNLSVAITPKLVVYVDGKPASRVLGPSSWDVGLQASLAKSLSLAMEYDQGQAAFVGLSYRFAVR